ncbi:MAG: MBL fold metallo-hydrolase [Deltaproteobacteria bacterium]|nr:MBL fold metallo-hydrolase [Deltaproteobacteria bacterium]
MTATSFERGLGLAPGVTLHRFVHPYFDANAWLVANDAHAVLIDTASNGDEDGARVADFVARSGRALFAVIVSHGHPDVFFGVNALRARFPAARFLVARPEIADDVVAMADTMERYGMLPSPALSPTNLDYRALFEVMPPEGVTLPGSASVTLRPWVTSAPSEFTRLTCLWMEAAQTLFASDLAYNHVHAWAGLGVDRAALVSWLGLLDELIAAHPGPEIRVITGHGPATDGNVLLAQRAYVGDLLALLDAGVRGEALEARMAARYPGHAGTGFQLHMTGTNPAWEALAAPRPAHEPSQETA